jgi:hypothetical protein
MIRFLSAGGSSERTHLRFWMSPLPSTGTIELTVDWPRVGQQTTLTFSAADLTAAAAQVVSLW